LSIIGMERAQLTDVGFELIVERIEQNPALAAHLELGVADPAPLDRAGARRHAARTRGMG